MSLWLENVNELDRYNTYLKEAKEHRLVHQGQAELKNTGKFFTWLMNLLGLCLPVICCTKKILQ